MRNTLPKWLLPMMLLGANVNAQATANTDVSVDDFAKHSMFNNVIISPTGEYLAATYPYEEHKRLAIIDNKTQKIMCNFVFKSDESVMNFWWANPERVLMTISKQSGQYAAPFWTGELFAGNADCSDRIQLFGYRNQDSAAANIESLLYDDPNNILISSNLEKKQFSNLYTLDVYTGKRKLVEKADHENASIILDNQDVWRAAQSYKTQRDGLLAAEASGEMVTYLRDAKGSPWKALSLVDMTRQSAQGSSSIIGFSADNQYMFTSDNTEASTNGIYRIKLADGSRELMYRNETVDAFPFINTYYGKDGKRIREPIGATVYDGIPKVIFFDENSAFAKDYRALEQAFPGNMIRITSRTKDNNQWLISTSSDVNPGKFYLFDKEKGKVSFLSASRPWIDESKMAKMQPISFIARDGVTMHGYLTLPQGSDGKNIPLIIHPHGGPHGPRDYWGFNDEVQFYANQGYGVLQINFRGSGGYGREFEDSGYGQWGGAMQDDLTDGTLWAIEQGYADKDKICISGASYGGYAALMGVVKEPDLYQCAIGYVGVYDLPLMFDKGNVAERLGWGKRYMEQAFGGTEAEMKRHSPAHNADKIKAGVMIVHGGRDEQAHYENAYVMRDALQKVGKDPVWVWKETEGHGFYDEENRKDLYIQMQKFLGQYLN
ncbi:S9 family peptidase [Shewanella sp. NIFS-20-20]|uniref:alpha/beta hydrolase family protein n=1 Tax=Shewanella sp. NIFS-20-20 TaxID=2853806 RepID=UPI001C4909D7|nr:S9 family peptidase [Shewanella sp. NIFS-20-20]MBV7314159.1 S9 family peptidase [Shewanella sp. NIFS-20-20]